MSQNRKNKDAEPEIPQQVRETILKFFWNRCRVCVVVAVVLMSVVAALVTTQGLWMPLVNSWRAPLQIVDISAVADEPRAFDVVVRNALPEPAVVTGAELEVKQAIPSRETLGGSSSLPVTEHFDALLYPEVGTISKMTRPPFQVSANGVERFRIRMGTAPSDRSARIEYRLILRFHVNQDDVVESAPFTARLLVR